MEKPIPDDMYSRVRTPRLKRDIQLPVLILLALAVLVAAGSPFVYAAWYQVHYRSFVSTLSDSTYYAYKNNGLYCSQNGEDILVTGDHNYLLFGQLIDEPGKLLRSTPEREADITLIYGDGGVLELWEVELTDASAKRDRGVCYRWTDAEGKVWIYDTDNFTFTTVSLTTDLAHNAPWPYKYLP